MADHSHAWDAAASATAAAAASKTTWWGAGAAGLGWLFSSEFAALIGAAAAIGGFLVNLYFRRREHQLRLREDARRQIEHEARMRDKEIDS